MVFEVGMYPQLNFRLLFQKDPYTMLKESSTQRVGNDRFEGICVDLVKELALELNFNYSFHLNRDDTPGRPDPRTKKWNGMIGELLDGVRRDLFTLFNDVLFVL